MNGVLVVDKPLGPTSHDVVAQVRRALQVRRVGHTGTLDPLATGVLPLVVGRATRLAQFFTLDRKEYLAGVRLGASTPTYDAEGRTDATTGRPVALLPADAPALPVDVSTVDRALENFRGTYWQAPPPFSAKKIGGVPAYRLARSMASATVAMKPVEVTVHELSLLAFDRGLATLRVVCSSGFYVRSLAHELGQHLGCGAHLESLRRTRAGEFGLESAVTLAALERDSEAALKKFVPMEQLLPGLSRIVLNERGVERASHGNSISPVDVEDGDLRASQADGQIGQPGRVRMIDATGRLLGIAERAADDLLRPLIVLV